jgi:hypothetical protein
VRRTDTQAVLHVLEVAAPGEQAEEVVALQAFHAANGRLVGEEALRLGVPEEHLVEGVDDGVGVLLGEGA